VNIEKKTFIPLVNYHSLDNFWWNSRSVWNSYHS